MHLIRFIIYSNILVSLAAGTLTYSVSSYFSFSDALFYGWCVTLATLFLYNLQRLMRFEDVEKQASDRHKWLVLHRGAITILCVLGAAGGVVTYLLLGLSNDVYLIIALTLVGFFYAYSGWRFNALRELPYLKIYLIAFVWTLVSVVWPVYREGVWNEDVLIMSCVVFLYILATTIPFDIRDLTYDHEQQKTIPQLLGKQRSKYTSALLLLFSAGTLIGLNHLFLLNPLFYSAYLGMIALIAYSDDKRAEMYFSGWIDGWIIVFSTMFLVT